METAKDFINKFILDTVAKWEKGCENPPHNLYLLDDMPNIPGNISFGKMIEELKTRVKD